MFTSGPRVQHERNPGICGRFGSKPGDIHPIYTTPGDIRPILGPALNKPGDIRWCFRAPRVQHEWNPGICGRFGSKPGDIRPMYTTPGDIRPILDQHGDIQKRPAYGQVFESQFGVTCMQGQGICKDRSKICNELSTASIELMDVE